MRRNLRFSILDFRFSLASDRFRARTAVSKSVFCLLLPAFSFLLFGCVSPSNNASTTQPVTAVDAKFADPLHWIEQPGVTTAESRSFDRLWLAAQEAARDYMFQIDRKDYRTGVITTHPLVSKQFFEFWRNEVQTIDGLAISSLGTVRRTIRYDVERTLDGVFVVTPRVVIERQVYASRRVGTSVSYQRVIGTGGVGTPESDQGILLPTFYWYAIGRDEKLEKSLSRNIEKRLSKQSTNDAS